MAKAIFERTPRQFRDIWGGARPTTVNARDFVDHGWPNGGDFKFTREKGYETPHDLWSRKLSEAHDWGLAQSIQKEGVREPVTLRAPGWARDSQNPGMIMFNEPSAADGHHRIAAAAEAGQDVPVKWMEPHVVTRPPVPLNPAPSGGAPIG